MGPGCLPSALMAHLRCEIRVRGARRCAAFSRDMLLFLSHVRDLLQILIERLSQPPLPPPSQASCLTTVVRASFLSVFLSLGGMGVGGITVNRGFCDVVSSPISSRRLLTGTLRRSRRHSSPVCPVATAYDMFCAIPTTDPRRRSSE